MGALVILFWHSQRNNKQSPVVPVRSREGDHQIHNMQKAPTEPEALQYIFRFDKLNKLSNKNQQQRQKR